MSDAPKDRIWLYDGVVYHHRPGPDDQDIECTAYVLASSYQEAVRQRDMLLEAADTLLALNTPINLRFLAGRVEQVRKAMSTPPLARGDVKTGKVVRDE